MATCALLAMPLAGHEGVQQLNVTNSEVTVIKKGACLAPIPVYDKMSQVPRELLQTQNSEFWVEGDVLQCTVGIWHSCVVCKKNLKICSCSDKPNDTTSSSETKFWARMKIGDAECSEELLFWDEECRKVFHNRFFVMAVEHYKKKHITYRRVPSPMKRIKVRVCVTISNSSLNLKKREYSFVATCPSELKLAPNN